MSSCCCRVRHTDDRLMTSASKMLVIYLFFNKTLYLKSFFSKIKFKKKKKLIMFINNFCNIGIFIDFSSTIESLVFASNSNGGFCTLRPIVATRINYKTNSWCGWLIWTLLFFLTAQVFDAFWKCLVFVQPEFFPQIEWKLGL